MKKQIRFMRPNPQSAINDIFLRGSKADKTMMIVIDSRYGGQPNSLRPGEKIPCLYKLGLEYITNGYEIIEKTMKQLKASNWKFRMTTDFGKDTYIKIIKKYTNKEIEFTKYKSMAKNTRSLIVFANDNSDGYIWEHIAKEYISLGKQVCVVNEYGVKRYPRSIKEEL